MHGQGSSCAHLDIISATELDVHVESTLHIGTVCALAIAPSTVSFLFKMTKAVTGVPVDTDAAS